MKILLLPAVLVLLVSACNPQEPVAVVDPVPVPAATSTADAAGATAPLAIVNWGQRSTPAGVPFNVQADGNSGVSFELNQMAPPADVVLSFDGKPLTGVVVGGLIITATIPAEYLAEPGNYPVVMELQPAGTRIEAGNFEVVKP